MAVAEEAGGAGGSAADLCAMVDEAAKALVPGPVATTALATLVISDTTLLGALASGARVAGVALPGAADIRFDPPRPPRRGRCRGWRAPRPTVCCCSRQMGSG